MKTKLLFVYLSLLLIFSCADKVNFTPEFMEQTSGRYVYNAEEVIDVYYKDGKMFIKWRERDFEPVVLDNNVIFSTELYSKLQFVQHPDTKARYLSIIDEEHPNQITYDYLKVNDDFNTPKMHLRAGNYQEAVEGFLMLKEKDSTSEFFNEREFNYLGYELLREEDYENAIAIFKLNVELFPYSDNVYDSLADGYLRSGDSVQAYTYYSKALEMNPYNKRAEKYLKAYDESKD